MTVNIGIKFMKIDPLLGPIKLIPLVQAIIPQTATNTIKDIDMIIFQDGTATSGSAWY